MGKKQIRQGLLLALLSSFLYYLATGNSPWVIPFTIPPEVTTYLLPLAGLGGVVLGLYGLYLRARG